MKRRRPFWRRLAAATAFFWLGSLLPAEAPPGGGLPPARWEASSPGEPLPSWFGPVQSFATTQTTVWRASVRPPPGPSQLAVTLVFEETVHGVARLIWQGPGRAVVLCQNLFEGAAPLHQRTILIDRPTLGSVGQLMVESAGAKPVLIRAELSWVEPLVLAATGWTPPGLFLAPSGRVFPAEELEGETAGPPADLSRERSVDAVLDPGPVLCPPQTPVRFLSTMSTAPLHARVQARLAGLRPGEEPEIWVNGARLPAVAVEMPGLDDPGYQLRALPQGQTLEYGGWRTAVAVVPPGWLRRGENQIEWISPSGSQGMTLRNVRLQVSYEPTGVAPAGVPALIQPTTPAVAAPVFPSSSPSSLVRPKLRLGLSSAAGGLKLRPE